MAMVAATTLMRAEQMRGLHSKAPMTNASPWGEGTLQAEVTWDER